MGVLGWWWVVVIMNIGDAQAITQHMPKGIHIARYAKKGYVLSRVIERCCKGLGTRGWWWSEGMLSVI